MHGESGAIVSLLTEHHGRHAGYVRGARSSRMRGVIEPGSMVDARWSSRVSDALGSLTLEQQRNPCATFMSDPLRLAAMQAACALCDEALPEREGHAGLYYGLGALFDVLEADIWGQAYVMWEIALLKELGFSLDFSTCAGGGDASDHCYVSPKTGRAVSCAAGAVYKDRLLSLPEFLKPSRGEAGDEDILEGLRLTGYFLENWVFNHHTRGVPEARIMFQERFQLRTDSFAKLSVDII